MITSLKIWNEPNNVSHWDFLMDPGWSTFREMVQRTVAAIRTHDTRSQLVLGGISPVDPNFLRLLDEGGALEGIDVLAVHGFPLDWNLWPLEEWPERLAATGEEFGRPVWVTETGASSFASEEIAAWGLRRSLEVLNDETVYWYTLLDLAPDREATTRYKQAEGSGYFRHFHFGLLHHDGSPNDFDPRFGICQRFQFGDEHASRSRWNGCIGSASAGSAPA